MKKTQSILISLIFASFLSSCSSFSATELPDAVSTDTVRIVFAGDFDSNEGCADHGSDDQCELYEATVDLNTGAVETVVRLTDTVESESYPVWHPNGERVYYSIFRSAKQKDIGTLGLESGETQTFISDATWPEVRPDGGLFLYVQDDGDTIMQAELGEDGIELGEATPLTGSPEQHDPDFSSDGRYVVFHDTSGEFGAGTVFDTQSQKSVSYTDRSGHCAFGVESLITLCDNVRGGGIFSRLYDEGKLGESALFVADQEPSVLATYDPELAVCKGTSFNYPTFCSDDEHLLVSTSCNVNQEVIFSRLFLLDLREEEPEYYPLGLNLAEAYGGSGMSSWTVDCLAD